MSWRGESWVSCVRDFLNPVLFDWAVSAPATLKALCLTILSVRVEEWESGLIFTEGRELANFVSLPEQCTYFLLFSFPTDLPELQSFKGKHR